MESNMAKLDSLQYREHLLPTTSIVTPGNVHRKRDGWNEGERAVPLESVLQDWSEEQLDGA